MTAMDCVRASARMPLQKPVAHTSLHSAKLRHIRCVARALCACPVSALADTACLCVCVQPIWNIGSMTPLMMAAHRGDVAIVTLLLDKKADKNITNHLGKKAVRDVRAFAVCNFCLLRARARAANMCVCLRLQVNYAKTDAIKALLA